ncbi:MAG: histidine--tRNA ligase [Candidatus Thorarchaeota archaeon]
MRTVRGMRDLMGNEMLVRNYIVDQATQVFKRFGYEPLDSPVMELWETLSAKGGEEVESETFKFEDKGGREVGLRFDLTVPLARIVASNPHLPKPFKRYAIGKAWRYDRPQAGRYREFMQADVDIIGASSPVADAEVVLVALEFARRTLKDNYLIKINNRKVLRGLVEIAGVKENLSYECFRSIDKFDKIGRDGVTDELSSRGISAKSSEILLDALNIRGPGAKTLDEFENILKDSDIGINGVNELKVMAEVFQEASVENQVEFDMALARGLDYYTGPVFEGRYLGKPEVGSILGGGRYDHLIEKFGGPPTPATGVALGIDRLVDIVIANKGLIDLSTGIDVFLAPLNEKLVPKAAGLASMLVKEGFTVEMELLGRPLAKLLSISDEKGARFTVIVGPKDIQKKEVSVRDMKTKETSAVKIDGLLKFLKSSKKK